MRCELTLMKKKKTIDKMTALLKLQRYCAYQDRCHQEVRKKLIDLGVYGLDLENVITELIADNFLNEERFACSYARGKFRMKGWGKIRIRRELKQRQISDYCIKKAMKEIEEVDYRDKLEALLVKKARTSKEKDQFKLNGALAKFAIGKGYETSLVWLVIKELYPR